MGHPLSTCLCTGAAARRHPQQHARASQPMADNYALATDEQTDEQTTRWISPSHKAPLCGGGLKQILNCYPV